VAKVVFSLGFQVPSHLSRHMIQKGSVAVDGISLTINQCDPKHFEVSIIPHTAKVTTIGFKKTGDLVNIETDMIGKYVEKLLTSQSVTTEKETGQNGIDMEFLSKTGFI
jgi:riboflavin synthase